MRGVFNRLARAGHKKVRRAVLGGTAAAMMTAGSTGMAAAEQPNELTLGKDVPWRVMDAHLNGDDICAPVDGHVGKPEIVARVNALTNVMKESETGAALIEDVKNGPAGMLWVCFTDDIKNMGQYRAGYGVMDLPDKDDPGHFVGTAAHEFRHYWQEGEGYGVFQNDDLGKKADEILTLASEADADAIAVQVMWELKQKGYSQNWDYHMDRANCDGAKVCRDDILTAYENAIKADENARDNGKALAAAFAQWYEDRGRRGPYLFATMMKHTGRRMAEVHGHEHHEQYDPGFVGDIESPISRIARVGELDGMGKVPGKDTNYLVQNGGYSNVMQGKDKRYMPYRPKS